MELTKSGLVAIELRRLADALDVHPETYIIVPDISFYGYDKKYFLATARILPRPLAKRVTEPDSNWARLRVGYKTQSVAVEVSIPQSLTCELVEPAKPAVYRCAPVLTAEEDAAMEVLV